MDIIVKTGRETGHEWGTLEDRESNEGFYIFKKLVKKKLGLSPMGLNSGPHQKIPSASSMVLSTLVGKRVILLVKKELFLPSNNLRLYKT